MITGSRRHPAAAAAALALLLAACASSGPVMEGWTAPPPGSSWEMAQRNTGSFGKDVRYTVTRGDISWKGASAVALANSQGITIVADPATGRFISFIDRNGKEMVSYDPPIGWDYPLKVGRSWSREKQRMTLHAAGRTLEFDFTCKVEDFEQVRVAAGSFGAFRIRCANNIGSEETYWASPEMGGGFVKTQFRRDASSPLGAGTQESELVSRGTR